MIDYSSTCLLAGILAAYLVMLLIVAWAIANSEDYDGDNF
jgi:hypothetical protein